MTEAPDMTEQEIEQLLDDRRMLLLCEGDRKEMAAEIERLKRDIENLQHLCKMGLSQEKVLREEIERLQTALHKLQGCDIDNDAQDIIISALERASEEKKA